MAFIGSQLEVYKARLVIAQLLGSLDRWIRRRLYESNNVGLNAQMELNRWAREKAKRENPGRTFLRNIESRLITQHPLWRYLIDDAICKAKELEEEDPRSYYGIFHGFAPGEWADFIRWTCETHRGCIYHTSEEHVAMWKKERGHFPLTTPYGRKPGNQIGRSNPSNYKSGLPPKSQTQTKGHAGSQSQEEDEG